jgi:hypothetical protein
MNILALDRGGRRIGILTTQEMSRHGYDKIDIKKQE